LPKKNSLVLWQIKDHYGCGTCAAIPIDDSNMLAVALAWVYLLHHFNIVHAATGAGNEKKFVNRMYLQSCLVFRRYNVAANSALFLLSFHNKFIRLFAFINVHII